MGGLLGITKDKNNKLNNKLNNLEENNLEKNKKELNIGEKAKKTYGEIHNLVIKALEIGDIKEKDFLKNLDKTRDIIGQIIKLKPKDIKLAKFLLKLNGNNYIDLFDKVVFDNKEVLEILLIKDVKIFNNNIDIKKSILKLLEKDYSKNKKLVFLVINNFIKNSTSLEEIKNFIQKIAGKNIEKEKELNNYYADTLASTTSIYKNDIKKFLFQIEETKVNGIIESKLLNKDGVINNELVKNLEEEISKKLNGTKKENKENIINYLLEKFNLNLEDLKNDSIKAFLNSFYDLLKINKKTKEIKNDKDFENTKKVVEEKENEFSIYDIDGEKNQLEEDSKLLDFCNGNCILSDIGNSYEITTGYNKIDIKKEEYKKFSSKTLENYLKFNGILYETGLSFLFENKYKSGFLQLLNTEFNGFDYTFGEGFSGFYLLQTLNIIAHIIGVPKQYYSGNGKLGSFPEESIAINTFKEINATGTINEKNLVNPGNMFRNGAAQERMENNGVIDPMGGFNIITAQRLLKEGGYREKSED